MDSVESLMDDVEVLVTDLDETLFPPETQNLPVDFQEALREWRTNSRKWVIATGRTREQLHLFYDDWHVHPDYYISRARFIHSWNDSSSDSVFSDWNNKMDKLTQRQKEYSDQWMNPLDEWAHEEGIPVQLEETYAVFNNTEDAELASDFIGELIDDRFRILRHRWFLIVIPSEVGKGKALDRLVGEVGWDPRRILCVGDGMNDIDMFDAENDYRRAVVSNAEEPVKDYLRERSGLELPWPGGEAITKLLEGSRAST